MRRAVSILAALAILTGCAERGVSASADTYAQELPDASLADAEIPDPSFHHEDPSMRKGLLTALVALTTLGGVGVLLSDTTYDSSLNAAPVMANLSNVSTTMENAVAITGLCTDDGKPTPPAAITYQWSQTAGPGTCTFGSSTSASTTVTCNTAGSVTLQLVCCDNGPAVSCLQPNSASKTLTATIVDPLTTLLAALGSNLYDMWEVARTDDATIDVQSGNVASINNIVGGRNALTQATAGSRPAYQSSGGPRNEPYVRIASGKSMSATVNIPQGYYGWYALVRQGLPTTASAVPVYQNHAVGSSAIWTRPSTGTYTTSGNFAGGANQVIVDHDPAANLVQPNLWALRSLRYLATGARADINGSAFTTNFANSNQGNAFTAHAYGSTGIGDVKMELFVLNPDATTDAAIQAYAQARWPEIYTYSADRGWIVFAGQSNNNTFIRRFTAWPGVAGYVAKMCSQDATNFADGAGVWAPGGAKRLELMAMIAAAPVGKPLVLVWNQGESDSANSSWAANHATYQAALFAEAKALRPDIYIIDTRFHATFLANASYPFAATVNNGKIAGTGANLILDPNTMSGALQVDNVHYDTTLNSSMFTAVAAATPPAPRRKKKRQSGRTDRRGPCGGTRWMQPANDNRCEALAVA